MMTAGARSTSQVKILDVESESTGTRPTVRKSGLLLIAQHNPNEQERADALFVGEQVNRPTGYSLALLTYGIDSASGSPAQSLVGPKQLDRKLSGSQQSKPAAAFGSLPECL